MGAVLEDERRGGVPGEGLEIADGLSALREERAANMPKLRRCPYGLLHRGLASVPGVCICSAFYLQIVIKREWTRRDSNS
jgi:hypothetical protein